MQRFFSGIPPSQTKTSKRNFEVIDLMQYIWGLDLDCDQTSSWEVTK